MDPQALAKTNSLRHKLVVGVFLLLAVIVFGLAWLFLFAPSNPDGFGWYLFSFAAGLSMIVLPCTLPLAFVIVPLSMGKGIAKGLSIALAFGAGVAITLSMYGVIAAIVGQFAVGSLGAPLEVVKNWVYFIAGIFAYLFALGEVGLIKFRMPSYSGAAPAFIQRQKDVVKALMLGLFLGNIGVGCPHPATPLILVEIATNGNIFYGWSLFFIHALGRVLPLLFLAVLGILGVNGLSWLISRKDRVEKATGWAMVFVGAFILILGLFTHDWWVNSGIHTQLEKVTQEERLLNIVKENLNSNVSHSHGIEDGPGLFGLPLWLGNWALVFLWIFPMWWWYARRKKQVAVIPDTNMVPEKASSQANLSTKKGLLLVITLLLALVFIYALPHNFIYHESLMKGHDHAPTDAPHDHGTGTTPAATNIDPNIHVHTDGMRHDHSGMADPATNVMPGATGAHDHTGHSAQFHEEGDVTQGLVVNFLNPTRLFKTFAPEKLEFFVNNVPTKTPVENLQINHDKYFHLIGVRDDLTQFFHIHPEKTAPGTWSTEKTFQLPGTYKVWSDITVDGTTHTFGHPKFAVTADPQILPEGPRYIEFYKNVIVGNYQVAITHPEPIVKGRDTHVDFLLKDVVGNGITVEKFLGADMHLAVIKDDLTTYLHTHPDDHAADAVPAPAGDGHDHVHGLNFVNTAQAHGPADPALPASHVGFTLNFPTAGIYKMFAQFRPAGIGLPPEESLLAEFYVRVYEDGPAYPVVAVADDHAHPAAPISKVLLVVISLVAMTALGFGVQKFINKQ